MKSTKPNSNSVALAGEFAALSQLALRGYDANLTLGNTKSVDILVSDPESGRMFRLEVKTSSYRSVSGSAGRRSKFFGYNFEWLLNKKNEDVIDASLFYCFVNIDGDEGTSFRFFIVPSELVAEYVKAQHALWLSKDAKRRDSAMRIFRLALEEDGYPLPTPSAARYENNWSFEIEGATGWN